MDHEPATPPPGPRPVDVLTVPAANLTLFAAYTHRVRRWARRVARWLYEWTRGSRLRLLFPFQPYIP